MDDEKLCKRMRVNSDPGHGSCSEAADRIEVLTKALNGMLEGCLVVGGPSLEQRSAAIDALHPTIDGKREYGLYLLKRPRTGLLADLTAEYLAKKAKER